MYSTLSKELALNFLNFSLVGLFTYNVDHLVQLWLDGTLTRIEIVNQPQQKNFK